MLALNALDTAELPMVRSDAGQVAFLMGIAAACAEWFAEDHAQAEIGELGDLALGVRELAHRLAADAGAVVAEVNPN